MSREMLKDLYFSKNAKSYFNPFLNMDCPICKKKIVGGAAYRTLYKFKKEEITIFCINCIKKLDKDKFANQEIRTLVSISARPKDAEPVFTLLKDLKDVCTYQEALELRAEKIIDRTKLAGKESFEGAEIGHYDKEELMQRDTEKVPALDYLKALKPAEEEKEDMRIFYNETPSEESIRLAEELKRKRLGRDEKHN